MRRNTEKLSYSRLVSRTDFYKQKALELEQSAVFAEERIRELEQALEQLHKEKEERRQSDEKWNELQEEFAQLKRAYEVKKQASEKADQLTRQLEEKEEQIKQLKKRIDQLEERQESEDHEQRIAQFENLLADAQKELNEKENLLHQYKTRAEHLEKRLFKSSRTANVPPQNRKQPSSMAKKVIGYFDYGIVVKDEKEAMIRGHFHLANTGEASLGTPLVCFRFYPADMAGLKGKVLSIEQADRQSAATAASSPWVFWEDEWTKEAKERGEIWIRPYADLSLKPGETIALNDFQIPIKNHFDEKIVIEAFIYFPEENFKEQAVNQILITM
ncbi:MAG TPA: hypothetical protein VFK44_00070 [Bacillales bacterium]|nr:hypothetical protein [Bacillales bacterium]